MPLIMVHRNNNIIPAAQRLGKYRIRRRRSPIRNMDALFQSRINCRLNLFYLLAPEQAVFSTVWIQSGNSNPWALNPKRFAACIGNMDNVEDTVLFDPVAGFPQGNMGGDMHNAQAVMGQHHTVLLGTRILGIYFSVPGEVMSRHIDIILVERIGDCGIDLAPHSQINHFDNILKGALSTHLAALIILPLHFFRRELFKPHGPIFFVAPFGYIEARDFQYINCAICKFRFADLGDPVDC